MTLWAEGLELANEALGYSFAVATLEVVASEVAVARAARACASRRR